MYLKEMGTIALLTKEGEIALQSGSKGGGKDDPCHLFPPPFSGEAHSPWWLGEKG